MERNKYNEFYSNGILRRFGGIYTPSKYVNIKHGYNKTFWIDGHLITEAYYYMGKPSGYANLWNEGEHIGIQYCI